MWQNLGIGINILPCGPENSDLRMVESFYKNCVKKYIFSSMCLQMVFFTGFCLTRGCFSSLARNILPRLHLLMLYVDHVSWLSSWCPCYSRCCVAERGKFLGYHLYLFLSVMGLKLSIYFVLIRYSYFHVNLIQNVQLEIDKNNMQIFNHPWKQRMKGA